MDFQVGLSADLGDGENGFSWGNIAIETLGQLPWTFLKNKEFTPAEVSGFDAIAFGAPAVTAESLPDSADAPLVISRFGVGYDNIDLAACTRAGTAFTITPDGSKKPVATAALALTLATQHRLTAKSNLARHDRWSERLSNGMGQGLNGKTVATIGLGNIGTEFFRLIAPFDCLRISHDPWKTQEEATLHNVTLVDLDTLCKTADVIVVLAALTPETRHLINASKLALMKSNVIIINISRGAIIDELALIAALQSGAIAGAGLDVFETEPPAPDNPLLTMENVVATPHNIAWTDELAYGMGLSAFTSISKISQGLIPEFVVNKDVLTTPQFLTKLGRFK